LISVDVKPEFYIRALCVLCAGSDWAVANSELTPANRFCINDLPTGERLEVRVVAVNAGGRSEPCALVEPVPIREVVGEFQTHLDQI